MPSPEVAAEDTMPVAALSETRLARPRFLMWFVPLFVLLAVFAIATPLWGSSDEPSQVVEAAAAVRGELLGKLVPYGSLPYPNDKVLGTEVSVPAYLAVNAPHPFPCYINHPEQSAGCAASSVPLSGRLRTTTYHSRYPPLYYLLVGWPTFLPSLRAAVFGARLLSALICAVLLGGAFSVAAESPRRALLLPAVLVATTPQVIATGASVSPSAMEITAAICAWTTGLAWVFDRRAAASERRVLHWFGASACVLALSRPLGPLWLALLVATLLMLGGGRAVSARLGDRLVRIWLCAAGISAAATLAWLAIAKSFDSRTFLHAYPFTSAYSFGSLMLVGLGKAGAELYEMIGVLGWNDTMLPNLIYWAELAVIGFFLVLVFSSRSVRNRLAVAGLLVTTIVLPAVADAREGTTVGFVWLGRYTLPLAVGIVLVAAFAVSEGEHGPLDSLFRRCAVVVTAVVAACQALTTYWLLRRFMVGLRGSLLLRNASWRPPLPAVVLLLVAVLAAAALGAAVIGSVTGARWRWIAAPTDEVALVAPHRRRY